MQGPPRNNWMNLEPVLAKRKSSISSVRSGSSATSAPSHHVYQTGVNSGSKFAYQVVNSTMEHVSTNRTTVTSKPQNRDIARIYEEQEVQQRQPLLTTS